MVSGLAAAEAVDQYLAGDPRAFERYERVIEQVRLIYLRRLAVCYRAETRWSAAPFWQRRSKILSPHFLSKIEPEL